MRNLAILNDIGKKSLKYMAISADIRRHVLGDIRQYWVILSDIKQYRLYYPGISMGYNDYSAHRIPLHTYHCLRQCTIHLVSICSLANIYA